MRVHSIIPSIVQVKTPCQRQVSQNKVNNVTFQKQYIEKPEVILGAAIALFLNPLISIGIFLTAVLLDEIDNNNNDNNGKHNNMSGKYKF